MRVLVFMLFLVSFAPSELLNLRPYDHTATILFRNMDTNQDSEFSIEELRRSYDVYDADKDGTVSRTEFTSYEAHQIPEMYSLSHALYDRYDFNGDSILTEEDFQYLYQLIDANGNQIVSEPEYVHWMKTVLESLDHLHHP